MRILFATQSGSLNLFEALRQELAGRTRVERAGFIVSDSWHYQNWLRANPGFETAGHLLLKEWEVTACRNDPVDLEALRRAEESLGNPGLFSAVIADRRWLLGPDCTFTQDYRRRFTDAELLSMLQAATHRLQKAFDELEPDLVVGFICVTALEYLAYLFARARGVRYLNMRGSRIGNNIFFGSTINDPTPEFAEAYRRVLQSGSPRIADARAHLARVRASATRYEGVVPPSARPANRLHLKRNPIAAALGVWDAHRRYRSSIAAKDNHTTGIIRPLVFHAVRNPLRARRVDGALRREYVQPSDLAGRRFAFFPMHTEPEVSLLVYGRPYMNQIEVIRHLALSLPIDMLLVVKEHPGMVGKRKLSAYRKILEIARVRFAPPESESRLWLQHASLVTVIVGSIGLEAAMLRIPVVTLGHIPFNILPDSMVRRATDLTCLSTTLRRAIEEHKHDEVALEAFVAATLETSVGVNLYSNLLGRKDAFREEARTFDEDIARLAEHVLHLLSIPPPPRACPDGGPW